MRVGDGGRCAGKSWWENGDYLNNNKKEKIKKFGVFILTPSGYLLIYVKFVMMSFRTKRLPGLKGKAAMKS